MILLWIGGLKVFPYEADGITPFVANSPLMSFFYKHHGFPYLSAAGRLVLKDFIMMGGAVVILADSASRALVRRDD